MQGNNYRALAVSIGEAAKKLGVSEHLIRRAVKEGIIQSVRFGPKRILIPIEQLDKLLNIEGEKNDPNKELIKQK